MNSMDLTRHPDVLIACMRGQLVRQKWIRSVSIFGSVWSGGLLIVGCLRMVFGVPPVTGMLFGIWAFVGLIAMVLSRGMIRVSTHRAAAQLDAGVPDSGDRFLTWCALPFSGVSSDWNDRIKQEIEVFSHLVRVPPRARAISHWAGIRLLIIWIGIATLQGIFFMGQQSTASVRSEVAGLLLDAAEDIQRTAPELPAISQVLQDEAENLRQNRVPNPRDVGVRSLSTAAAELRALAASIAQKTGPSSEASPNGGSAGLQAGRTPQPTAAMPDLPVTADASVSNAPANSSMENSRRLERLASRLDEKKRSAAGLGDTARNEESASQDDGNGDPNGSSLLEQLAAGNNPSSPGPVASDTAAPGPGSENDFGAADMQQAWSESLNAVTGPELSADVPISQNASGTRFSIVSRESGNSSSVDPSTQSPVSPEFQEQTVDLEDIPLGAREMVRRYFDLVRSSHE